MHDFQHTHTSSNKGGQDSLKPYACSNAGFTITELLIVIGILAVLTTVVTVVINPVELLKQGRDSTRLSDLNQIDSALSTLNVDLSKSTFGSSSVVYISLQDSNSNCSSYDLPSLPDGWSYNCVTSSTLHNVDGTGWIPADFESASFGASLSHLPVDPINTATSGLYYTYIAGSWEIEAVMESEKRIEGTGSLFSRRSSSDVTALLTPGLVRGRACGNGGTLTDSRDGTEYDLTLIGHEDDQQCWFAENLDYDDGCSGVAWVNDSDEGWCGYHSSDTGNATGLLYQWSAAMDDSTTEGAQGLCPSGWHIPTDAEIKTMEISLGMSPATADTNNFRGDDEGGMLKQGGASNPGWSSEECGEATACNISGGTVMGGGERHEPGSFDNWRGRGYFWSSSPWSLDNTFAWIRGFESTRATVLRNAKRKGDAASVRCLKD